MRLPGPLPGPGSCAWAMSRPGAAARSGRPIVSAWWGPSPPISKTAPGDTCCHAVVRSAVVMSARSVATRANGKLMARGRPRVLQARYQEPA
jgi:hypothetical protein